MIRGEHRMSQCRKQCVPRYNSAPEGAPARMIWFLALFPPCLAYILWRGVGYKTEERGGSSNAPSGLSGNRVRLGRHGYWVLLAICYAGFLGAALLLHKV